MKHSGVLLGGFFLFAAGVGSGWAVRTMLGAPEAEASETLEEDEAPVIDPASMRVSVATSEVTRGALSMTLAAFASVRASPSAEHVLAARAGGRVLEILAAPGQFVKQGELLLRLDPASARVALSRAQASLAEISNQLAEFERTGSARQTADLQAARQRAISEVALLEAQLARIEPLLADGLVAEKAVAEARQALEIARTDREASDAALSAFESSGRTLQHSTLTAARDAAEFETREAERGLAEIEVRAPSAGRLAEWSVRSGEWLAPGAALGRWISAAGRELSLQVPASRWSELALGQRVTWLDARGETRSAPLVRIDGAVATQSGTVEAIAKPEAGEDALLPGLQLFAEIELARLTDALLVPERA
ncbi:MAG TPA: HlyD family efflux transporter periplasmic adaptor subunit, partial [Planctomycetota bacterium]|nr:HlyD family efflux transporter periplasmic adaptor subunit [Planctomycetota bacterium]